MSINYINSDLLSKIKESKSIIDRYRPFDDEHLLGEIRKFYRVGLTYSSNAIEGNSYTLSETAVLLEDGLTVGGKPMKDALEVIGHGKAYDYMFSLLRGGGINLFDVMELHRLFYFAIDEASAGKPRNVPVYITGSEYIPPPPNLLPKELDKLGAWLGKVHKIHPIRLAAQIHKKIADIHPFIDGNGRAARLAMNVILIQNGYIPAVIPPILRHEYISCLEKAHDKNNKKNGNIFPFVNFIAQQVYESLKDFLRMLGE